MYIPTNLCNRFEKEVRDWKTGKTKKIKLRCKNILDCGFCAWYDKKKYLDPINRRKENNEPVYAVIVTNDNWDAVRKALQRSGSQGYERLPISLDECVLVTDVEIKHNVVQMEDIDIDKAILAAHSIDIPDGCSKPRRTATGIFKETLENGELIAIEWPEPVFETKNRKRVPNSEISSITRNFLQYLSPLTEITPENVNFYLNHKARLKAVLVPMVEENYKLVGFHTVNKAIREEQLADWNIIPLNEPEKSNLTNNPTGKMLVDMIFFGRVPSFDDLDWNLSAWTDYDENIIWMEEIMGGA